jgi:GH15 family glucan-1,4-alpha-glucosidase
MSTPIAEYALLSDCSSVALVSRRGSVDWCCMPRIDAESCFGRLLDEAGGGYCQLGPQEDDVEVTREYVEGSMVLRTTFSAEGGEAIVTDFLAMRNPRKAPYQQLIRIVDGVRGEIPFSFLAAPRFDYGMIAPWVFLLPGQAAWAAIGGQHSLLIAAEHQLQPEGRHDLRSTFMVRSRERLRFSITWMRPEVIDAGDQVDVPTPEDLDRRLEETVAEWKAWSRDARVRSRDAPAVIRSAVVLKALSNVRTGAIAAAATTSLPESLGGDRNFDYRYSWIRDSAFSVNSLGEIGLDHEADAFRRYIQRSAAGSGEGVQIMYGVGGERSLLEHPIDRLDGYEASRPVRVGNAAASQLQLGAYGELVQLGWRWHLRGHSPSDDYWRFLVDVIDLAAERWSEPDHGIWEMRGKARHFVHSKAMAWVALDRGVRLAEGCMRKAPIARWRKAAREIRDAIESHGYDRRRGIFVQTFGSPVLDAALLLLPIAGFVDHRDPRMVRTVDAIRSELEEEGFLHRYMTEGSGDGFESGEGRFLACSFWLVECLAEQGRLPEAREVFDRVSTAANDVGLFSEEYDPRHKLMLGNFPQALTHLSHIEAAVALADEVGRHVA